MTERLTDPDIASLENVTDARWMLGVFGRLWGKGLTPEFCSVDVRVLRYRRGRSHCVMEYSLVRPDGSEVRACIGKVFGKRRRAERLYRVIDALHRHLGDRTPGPVPLAYLMEHALVIMSKLEGAPLGPILEGPSEQQAVAASALAAQALALLHSVPVEEGKAGSLEDELVRVRTASEEFGQLDPALALEGERLLVEIEKLARRLPQPAAPSLTHGSFRPTEVLVTSQRAAICDLDGWALGDPAFDIGYYMADIWWESHKTGDRAGRYGDCFLDQYLTQVQGDGLRERCLMYEGFTYVRYMLKKLRAIERGRDSSVAIGQAANLLDQARSRLALVRT